MRRLLPTCVVVLDERGAPTPAPLHPEEAAAVANAVPSRQVEFAGARASARRALAELGRPAVAVPRGPGGAPTWPQGVVGSITHCRDFRAVAVAESSLVRSVGIDAEPHAALPDGVAEVVLVDDDRLHPGADVHVDRVAFSAKESAYKAWYPLRRRRIDFEQVVVDVRAEGTFVAHVDDDLVLDGRWLVHDDLVLTAVVLLR